MHELDRRAFGRAWIAGCLALLLVLGCASGGRRFNADAVPAIQRGRWTQRDVRARFGEPTGVQVRGSGLQVWTYRYEEVQSKDTGTLFRIGAFLASIFGAPFYSPPVNVRTRNATVYALDVEFDARGVVLDYVYTRETRPDREVY